MDSWIAERKKGQQGLIIHERRGLTGSKIGSEELMSNISRGALGNPQCCNKGRFTRRVWDNIGSCMICRELNRGDS